MEEFIPPNLDVKIIREAFSRTLKILRKEKNMTQLDLIEKTGLSPREVTNLENEKRTPTILTIYKLSSGLDIDITNFMERLNKELQHGV